MEPAECLHLHGTHVCSSTGASTLGSLEELLPSLHEAAKGGAVKRVSQLPDLPSRATDGSSLRYNLCQLVGWFGERGDGEDGEEEGDERMGRKG